MSAASSPMSFWIKFFSEAGIPAGIAANYAVIFTEHRIQEDMLLDLNKEYLHDMGVTTMGDVIAILKNAKTVHSKSLREKALKTATTTSGTSSPKRSTPASRTVSHYMGKDPEARPMSETAPPPSTKISVDLASRLGTNSPSGSPSSTRAKLSKMTKEEVPVPKIRRVLPEHEGRYKVIMPKGTTAKTKKILQKQEQASAADKSSVFSRLGSGSADTVVKTTTESKIKVTGLGKKLVMTDSGKMVVRTSQETPSSVFRRLGGKTTEKRAASSTCPDSDDSEEEERSALEYAGVLKMTTAEKRQAQLVKKKALVAQRKKLMEAKKKAAQQTSEVSTTSQGIFASERPTDHMPVIRRLGKQQMPSGTTASGAGLDFTINKDLSSRLGPPKTSPVSSSQDVMSKKITLKRSISDSESKSEKRTVSGGKAGVFNRLGKAQVS